MKVSYNKLQELLPDLKASPSEVADILTMHSFETVVEREYSIDPRIIVVEILNIEPHPNADRLRLATVTDGTSELRVVCGAPNIAVGQRVPYSPPGSKVYDDNGEQFTITEATIRGVQSPGMLNSTRELGMSDDHSGIFVLLPDVKVGSYLHEIIPGDTILEVDILPDRAGDVKDETGVAIELAALFQLKSPIQIAKGKKSIAFNPDAPSKYAGVSIPHEEVKNILESLGFVVIPAPEPESKSTWMPDQVRHDDLWEITPPKNRLDILGPHDLIDEVVRLHGLDDIPASSIVNTFTPQPVSQRVYWTDLIRKELVSAGFTETYSYSFEDEKMANLVGAERHPHIELVNPMAPELKKLRYSMLPGLLAAMMKSRDEIHREKKHTERALFEIGRVYHRGDGGTVPGVIERPVVAGIAVGDESVIQEILNRIQSLFQLEMPTVIPAPEPESTWTPDPAVAKAMAGRQVRGDKPLPFSTLNRLMYGGEFFGITYVASQDLLKKMKYRLPVVAFEISINALLQHAPDVEVPTRSLQDIANTPRDAKQFTPLPKYPSVFRDISIVVKENTPLETIQGEIERIGKQWVVDVDLFDEYTLPLPEVEGEYPEQGRRVGEAQKSIAFHIEYQSKEKTLIDAEISELHQKIEHALKKKFEAEIR